MNAADALIQSAPAELIALIKEIQTKIGAFKNLEQALLYAHAAEQGWSHETHYINLDLTSGMFTVTPRQQEAAA